MPSTYLANIARRKFLGPTAPWSTPLGGRWTVASARSKASPNGGMPSSPPTRSIRKRMPGNWRSGNGTKLLPPNPVGFRLHCRLFGHAEELFREVGHGDERLEFRGDLLGNILSSPEGVAESVDIDFSEDFFGGCFPM